MKNCELYDEGWMDAWDSLESKLENLVFELKSEGKHDIALRVKSIYSYVEEKV